MINTRWYAYILVSNNIFFFQTQKIVVFRENAQIPVSMMRRVKCQRWNWMTTRNVKRRRKGGKVQWTAYHFRKKLPSLPTSLLPLHHLRVRFLFSVDWHILNFHDTIQRQFTLTFLEMTKNWVSSILNPSNAEATFMQSARTSLLIANWALSCWYSLDSTSGLAHFEFSRYDTTSIYFEIFRNDQNLSVFIS